MNTPVKPGRAMGALVTLSLINWVNYLDRYVVAGVLPKIEAEFGLSHDQAGLLGTLFIVVYMVASPVGGYLGDRIQRRWLVAGSVFLWSMATVGSGLAGTFAALLFARAVIGIGEAGYGTVAPSLIADLFPRERRTLMLSFFYVALPVGAAAGYAVGGYFAEHSTWHSAFYAAGIPGFVLALGALSLPEPARGGMDPNEHSAPEERVPFLVGLKQLARLKDFWFNTVGQTLMTFSIGGLAYWMPSFLELERGIAASTAGLVFGGVTAVAGLLGTLAGGYGGDFFERRAPGGLLFISGVGLTCAAPFMILAANVSHPSLIFGAIFLALFLVFFNTGPLNAAMCNCVEPHFRAFAMGLNVLFIHLLGDAISPPLIGRVARFTSLEYAIELNALPVFIGGIVLLAGARMAKRAELKMAV